MYSSTAIILYSPPMDTGIPKSVKLRKNDKMNAAIRVPKSGRTLVIHKVRSGLSPIILDTVIKFLSI